MIKYLPTITTFRLITDKYDRKLNLGKPLCDGQIFYFQHDIL